MGEVERGGKRGKRGEGVGSTVAASASVRWDILKQHKSRFSCECLRLLTLSVKLLPQMLTVAYERTLAID